MKNLCLCFGLAATLGACSSGLSAPFEGEIEYLDTGTQGTSTSIYHIKGNKARYEPDAKNNHTTIIIDYGAHLTTHLENDMKMYAVTSNAATGATGGTVGQNGYKLTRTGKTDTILGIPCEEWLWETPSGKFSQWGDKGMAVYLQEFQDAKSPQAGFRLIKEMKSKGHYALKTVFWYKNGDVASTSVAIRYEKKLQDDSLFLTPVGYKQVDQKAMDKAVLDELMKKYKKP